MRKGISNKSGLFFGCILTSLLCFSSCKSDTEPTEQDLTFEKLEGKWLLMSKSSIELDGQDVSLNYPNFSLSFTDGAYNTTNAGKLFRASGTWEWSGDKAEQVIVDDEKVVTIVSLSLHLFIFTFHVDGQGGVVNGVNGAYRITLEK